VSLDALICGEGDKSAPVAPDPKKLTTRSEAEADLLRAFRRLPARRRKALLEMID
jgi:DNA-directed RNA polymerase specialized sigma24 family protein